MTPSKIAIIAVLSIAAFVLVRGSGCQWSSVSKRLQPPDPRPTIIFVYADDLDFESVFEDWPAQGDPSSAGKAVRFPTIKSMADAGIVFTNLHVTTPVCGPSRACLLTGQYAHRNGVRVNQPGEKSSNGFPGGFGEYDPKTEFACTIKKAGYQTCFVGKYVHDGFNPNRELKQTWQSIRPPGWDVFQGSMGSKYTDFHVVDAVSGKSAQVESEYRTDYETDRVIDILDQWDDAQRAQMICWLSLAPHDDAETDHNSAKRHRDLYVDSEPPSLGRNTDFRDLRLPEELAALPKSLSDDYRKEITRLWRSRLRATKALDEGLARIRERLREQGRLENTIFVISSDHGFRLGEHGHIGKRLPYDRITRVPAIICGPGIKHGTCNELLANIDFAPTLIELTCPPDFIDDQPRDGRSFANLLKDPSGRLDPPRKGVILENWEYDVSFGNRLPATWTTWRTLGHAYTEWATGGRECYNLVADPEQRDNLYSRMTPQEIADYSQQLRAARKQNEPPTIAHIITTGELHFEEPQNGNFQPVVLDGFVDCDNGVSKVELELHSSTLDQYWTGDRWTSALVRANATPGNPDGLVSSWRFPIDTATFLSNPPRKGTAVVDLIDVTVAVIVTDRKGVTTRWTSPQSIQLTTSDPDSFIDPIQNPVSRAYPILLTGSAVDETGVKRVRIIINDKETGKFWNGTDWVTDYETVDATISATFDPLHVDWRYEFNLDNNHRIYFGARAVDGDRNYDRTVSWFELEPYPTDSKND